MQEIPLPHQQKVVCVAVPALVLHCVFCCAVSPDCPPYNTAPSPRTDHHSPTRTASNSCRPWTTLTTHCHSQVFTDHLLPWQLSHLLIVRTLLNIHVLCLLSSCDLVSFVSPKQYACIHVPPIHPPVVVPPTVPPTSSLWSSAE